MPPGIVTRRQHLWPSEKNVLIRILGWLVAGETLLVCVAHIIGGMPVHESLLSALLISSPLIANYVVIFLLKDKRKLPAGAIYWSLIGAFAVNLGVGAYLLNMYAPGILANQKLGPAEGYWLLFSIGFSVKLSVAGFFVGAFLSMLYYVIWPGDN
jgi:hypothetical protein